MCGRAHDAVLPNLSKRLYHGGLHHQAVSPYACLLGDVSERRHIARQLIAQPLGFAYLALPDAVHLAIADRYEQRMLARRIALRHCAERHDREPQVRRALHMVVVDREGHDFEWSLYEGGPRHGAHVARSKNHQFGGVRPHTSSLALSAHQTSANQMYCTSPIALLRYPLPGKALGRRCRASLSSSVSPSGKKEGNYPRTVGKEWCSLSPWEPPRLAAGEKDAMEAVPDELLRSTVFLSVRTVDGGVSGNKPVATGFWVRVPIEGFPGKGADYIVTARHCIEEARGRGSIFIRYNIKGQHYAEVETRIDDWVQHDTADVAAILLTRGILPTGVKSEQVDQVSLRMNDFVGGAPDYTLDFKGKKIQPRVGHELFCVGLFTEHEGEERNLPIARFGQISRMPSEIDVPIGEVRSKVVAYLAEFHSWSGHSGSPVFFMYPFMMRTDLVNEKNQVAGQDWDLIWVTGFIGLISGHYDIKKKARTTGDILGSVQVKHNSGIAILTPAEAIRQLLLREDIVEPRQRLAKQAERNKPMPTMDSVEVEPTLTKKDFEAVLKKVSRRSIPPSPPAPASS